MSRERADLAQLGEELAARHLEQAGWRIAGRRVRTRYGEIDLIATRGNVVAFVEVKTRSSDRSGRPAEAIDRRKAERLRRAALSLHESRAALRRLQPRIDVMEVLTGDPAKPVVVNLEGAIDG